MILAATFAWLPCAHASEPDEPAATAGLAVPSDISFAAELERAKQAYFEGRSAEAFEQFRRLELRLKSGGETPPWSEAVEAMTWLAEIQFTRGDVEAAEATFRWILERDVATPMLSPYHHPIDVVSLFEEVRVDIENERRVDADREPVVTVVARPTPPSWTFTPLGVPQLAQGKTGLGITLGALQLGFGVTSIVTNLRLSEINRDLEAQNPPPSNAEIDAQYRPGYRRLHYVNWASVGLLGATWIVSVVDGRGTWNKRHELGTFTIGPTPAGVPGVTFRGTL
jgi:hypothetical protein